VATSAQHRRRDLESERKVAAEGGEVGEGAGFAGGTVVAFVRLVKGMGDEGDRVLRRKGFKVDEADGEGVGAVAGGDEDAVVADAGEERGELGGGGRVVED
jgi:hypothetical protein